MGTLGHGVIWSQVAALVAPAGGFATLNTRTMVPLHHSIPIPVPVEYGDEPIETRCLRRQRHWTSVVQRPPDKGLSPCTTPDSAPC